MHALMLVLKTADIQDYRITGLQDYRITGITIYMFCGISINLLFTFIYSEIKGSVREK